MFSVKSRKSIYHNGRVYINGTVYFDKTRGGKGEAKKNNSYYWIRANLQL